MRHILLLSLIVLSLASIGCGDSWDTSDPYKIAKQAAELVKEGKYDKALKRFQWVHQWYYTEDAPDYDNAEVVYEFALNAWCRLSNDYPKAREALVKVRDLGEKELLQGKESVKMANEVMFINDRLKENERSVSLFKKLNEDHPQLAKQYYAFAELSLVKAREYQLCSKYIPDPIASFKQMKEKRDIWLSAAKRQPKPEDQKSDERFAETYFTKTVSLMVELLAGSGRKEEAVQIRSQALEISKAKELIESLDAAMRRASE